MTGRRVAGGGIASYAALGTQLGTGLLILPLGVRHFGAETYGVWLVLVGLSGYALIATSGLAMAALTDVARASSDPAGRRRIAERALLLGVRVGAVLLLVGAAVAVLVQRAHLLPAPGFGSDSGLVVFAFFVSTAAIGLGNVAAAVLGGHDEVVLQKVVAAGFSLSKLIAVLGVIWMDAGTGTYAVLQAGLDVVLALVALSLCGAVRRGLGVRPGVGVEGRDHVRAGGTPGGWPGERANGTASGTGRGVGRRAVGFAAVQAQVQVMNNTDTLIIAAAIGPAAVPAYAGLYRLFQVGTLAIQAAQAPILPMLARDLGAGQWQRVALVFGRLRAAALLAGISVVFVGVLFAEPVMRTWIGLPLSSEWLPLAMAVYVFLAANGSTTATLLNAMGNTRSQALIGCVEAVINIGLSLLLVRAIGAVGVATASAVAVLLGGFWLVPRSIKHHTGAVITVRTSATSALVALALVTGLLAMLARPAEPAVRTASVLVVLGLCGLAYRRAWHGTATLFARFSAAAPADPNEGDVQMNLTRIRRWLRLHVLRRARFLLRIDQHYRTGGRTIVLPPDHLLPEYQSRHPEYDRYFIPLLAALAETSKDLVLIDIGANVGDTTVVALDASPHITVVAVEGNPAFTAYFKRNTAGLEQRVHLVPAFAGRPVPNAVYQASAGSTGGFVPAEDGAPPAKDPGATWVSVAELLPDDHALTVWKSDTDGYDVALLVDNWEVVSARCPVIWFEYDPVARLTSAAAATELGRLLADSGRELLFYDNLGRLMGRANGVAAEALYTQLTAWLHQQQNGQVTVVYLDIWAVEPDWFTCLAPVLEGRERTEGSLEAASR
jgi:FkbM family methyltransferase